MDEEVGELVTLDYNRMCCVLWGVCQGLQARVEALEKKGKRRGSLVIKEMAEEERSSSSGGLAEEFNVRDARKTLPDRAPGSSRAQGPDGRAGPCGPTSRGRCLRQSLAAWARARWIAPTTGCKQT